MTSPCCPVYKELLLELLGVKLRVHESNVITLTQEGQFCTINHSTKDPGCDKTIALHVFNGTLILFAEFDL